MSSHSDEIEEEQISRIEKGKGKDCQGGIETVICTSPSIVCLTQKLIAEMIGTYFIVFSGCGVVVVNVLYGGTITFPGICVTWGLIVMVMIYSTGHISGAHFNPAVTVTFAIFRRFPWHQVPLYIGAQFAGSLLASLTLRLMFKVTPEAFFGTTPADSPARALVAEIIISFLLMFVISGVATDNRAVGELAGIAVGMTIMVNVFVAGPISGASMNPARSLGPALVMGVYKHIWVYIVGPVLGVISGGFVYNLIRFTDKPLRELTKSASFLRAVSPSHKGSSSKT
ncbi:pollen-specific membrane integral protein-like [Arabidopsis thaliana]|uniref:Putative aquaporin NIP4-1 n=1 Tax=Arabidopsis thaliana TaxID=3702 RepID=NIP41_ARATH|nr:NOD26-like intrinsic protein 4;1 [Arabidopsis thaliana]Q9FIZ9.1 RecName: Full=Putative aquaporin NIP4-1; AltName: Full=NOD26-like intrinsic protein 4-1; Short=AtNIP4;1 [Arabidopsis thaliana]AED94235.1 NOD26-like intrinsic protein 4;1 [Arabidopsis thaliana]BAB10360.1 pollen-specific membrane integral protein-like [Arabidopsis thaliana]|eukprot:NP_198597.1 NOD26-like intrinsic protein 4;1 [Arabidopsis thaliana]